jgi:hypothetical protein
MANSFVLRFESSLAPAQGRRPNLNSGSGVKGTRTSPSWRRDRSGRRHVLHNNLVLVWMAHESGLPGVVDLLDVSNHGSGRGTCLVRSHCLRPWQTVNREERGVPALSNHSRAAVLFKTSAFLLR